jgi:NADH:ubiquinone oxidoreductase subunit 6 (subunit J)
VVLAASFFYLSAPLVGVFQLAVLAGAVTVLFIIALMLTGKVEVD